MLAGCATPPPADDADAVAEWDATNDPLEPMNRAVFAFNQGLDRAVLKPVALGYREVVPEFGRHRVSDFLANLKAPLVFVNDLLQGELARAAETLERFSLNTTFGVFGVMDVATPLGIAPHSEDLGQTLAVWGVGEGPYLVLPILGPSNPRDAGGLVAEWFADPVNIWARDTGNGWATWTRTGAGAVDTRERYLDVLDEVQRSSLDYYSSLRSLYRQRRDAEIKNGKGAELLPAPGVGSQLNEAPVAPKLSQANRS